VSDLKDIFADPWLKQAGKITSLPDDALFVCNYDLNIGPDFIEEAAFFRRTENTDELWIVAGSDLSTIRSIADGTACPKDFEREKLADAGRVFAVPRKDEYFFACLNLLDRFFRARLDFYWPQGFITGGIINKSAFDSLVGRIEHELEENAQKALETETEIIKVARELDLSPQPTGTGHSYWKARCPENNHQLYINAAENSFGCRWCKRKGAAEELRAFVKERKDRRTNSTSGCS